MAEPFLLTMMLHQLKVLAFVINEDPNTTIKPKFHFKRGACLWQWPHRPKLPHRQQAMACPQANSLCPFCIISKLYVLQDLAAPHTKPAQQYGSMHISHNGFPSPYWFMLPSRLATAHLRLKCGPWSWIMPHGYVITSLALIPEHVKNKCCGLVFHPLLRLHDCWMRLPSCQGTPHFCSWTEVANIVYQVFKVVYLLAFKMLVTTRASPVDTPQ